MTQKIKNLKFLILLVFLISNFFIWYGVFAEQKDGFLIVSFLDIGQGDAIFIEAPNGNQILIDGGRNKKVLQELSKLMPFYDRSIDVVIATHPDADHIGGLPAVLSRFSVDFFLESGALSDSGVYKEMENVLKEKNIKKLLVRGGMKIKLAEDIYLEILFPDRDASLLESNTASIVALLEYKENSFLLTGDSPKSIEKYLAFVYGKDLKVDVLKVGHHGSKTSSSEIFLGYTNPQYAVISVGKDNSYGHPHPEVLENLEKFGIEILRTDELGTITIKSDGNKLILK